MKAARVVPQTSSFETVDDVITQQDIALVTSHKVDGDVFSTSEQADAPGKGSLFRKPSPKTTSQTDNDKETTKPLSFSRPVISCVPSTKSPKWNDNFYFIVGHPSTRQSHLFGMLRHSECINNRFS